MTKLKNKIVFITGASSGIGAACARQFAEKGAKLILLARRSERLDELAAELKKAYGTESLIFAVDVSEHQKIQAIMQNLPQEWKAIDVLVNSAGLAAGRENFAEGLIENWEQMIDTNLKGLLYVTREILPLMLKHEKGHIINIGSTAAHQAYVGGNIYCATKAGVKMLSACLKQELLGTPIRVTEIDPGLTETEFSVVRFKGDVEKAKAVYEGMVPLKPEDIADAIVYCASRPPHVNIMEMMLYSTDQSSVQMVHRRKKEE